MICVTDFHSLYDDDKSVMKKRGQLNTVKKNPLVMDYGRAPMVHDLELFDEILKQLDELRQWCEDIEDRLWWIEEAVRLSKSSERIKVPQWFEAWLKGKNSA